MTSLVAPVPRRAGKGRQPVVIERIRDLEDEVRALHAERASVGAEVRALSARIAIAVRADRPDLALQVAGRLQSLGDQLLRRGNVA